MAVEARNRTVRDWFTRVRTGQITLPRFQRFEAWTHKDIAELLETVVRGLPCGATLVLEVGDKEQFVSRHMETAPHGMERVSEQLLDGQQRPTSLWRSLHDNYEDRTYLMRWVTDSETGDKIPEVLPQSRWERKGSRYPLWCDDPLECWKRGYFPLRLLNPESEAGVRPWTEGATGADLDSAAVDRALASRDIESEIIKWRALVANYNVPYLGLPQDTPKHVALDVFIKMNTSAVRLTPFDIVVAQLEAATGESLHDLVDGLRAEAPAAERYVNIGDLVLNVASLREDRPPTQVSYQRLDLERVAREWDQITDGIKWAIGLLEEEHVFDATRLPSVAVLPLLAALHQFVPPALDHAGNARSLAKAFLWRSFLTGRYELSAAGRSLQDFRGMRDALREHVGITSCTAPIFDKEQNPIPTVRDLVGAGWPRRRETLARGILAIALRTGGVDIADGKPASAKNLGEREYHHLFPDSLLTKIGELDEQKSYRALNCALVTWSTNRNISNKPPLQYLEDRVNGAQLGLSAVRSRLQSHLIPYDELATAGPYGPGDGDRIRADYEQFLTARAEMMLPVIAALCDGQEPR